MKNRYDNILREHNQEILAANTYVPHLFYVGAHLIGRHYRRGMRVLEIGCGEGDTALPVLERTKAVLNLLDVSTEMIRIARGRLKRFAKRTRFMQADAYEHLRTCEPYDIIYSGWTIHNFKQTDKRKLYRAIHRALKPGGMFVLMDKVYAGRDDRALLKRQEERYGMFLSKRVREAIIWHEREDFSPVYRMDEKRTLAALREVGFRRIRIVDRIEREIVPAAFR